MLAALATGALASALAGAGLSALILWIVALVANQGRLDGSAPVISVAVGMVVGVVVLLAERIALRRTRRAWTLGEPWAYRGDGGSGAVPRHGDPRG